MTRRSQDAVVFSRVQGDGVSADRLDDLMRGSTRPFRGSLQRCEQERCGVIESPFGIGKREFFLSANRMSADGVEAFRQTRHGFDNELFC